MKREWTLKAAKILVLVVGCVALVGVVVMSLWNALVPDIFGGTPTSWVQALGLLLLVRILAGGRGQTRWGGRRRWRERWNKRVANMTPEQRARWSTRMEHSCWETADVSGERPHDEPGPLEA